jgi:hypothetical protein
LVISTQAWTCQSHFVQGRAERVNKTLSILIIDYNGLPAVPRD